MFRPIGHSSNAENNDNEGLWGLRIDRRVKKSCQHAAGLMGVPASLLVSFIITTWLNNAEKALSKKDNLILLSTIVKAYGLELDHKPAPPRRQPQEDEDAIFNPTINWTIRNVSVKTRLALRVLALNRGITVSRVIDDLVAKELERAGNGKEVLVPGMSGKLRREAYKVLKLLDMPSPTLDTDERSRQEEIQRWLATDQDPFGLHKKLRSRGFPDKNIVEVRMEWSRLLGFRI